MATQESSVRGGGFGSAAVAIVAIIVLLGIGFSFWPKIKAAYHEGPITTNVQPTQAAQSNAELERLRAQNAAIQAQLNAEHARTIIQSVPEGAAAQPVTLPAQPTAAPEPGGVPADPPARQVVIVQHENDAHGAPIITGSGACVVAAKGARRCGK